MAVVTLEMALEDKEPLFSGATCRGCGLAFFDESARHLCDACLCERINGAGFLEDDDPDDPINLPAAPWATSSAPGNPALIRAYWAGEVAERSGALERLGRICTAAGYSYQATVQALR